jgi:hypothetical protein
MAVFLTQDSWRLAKVPGYRILSCGTKIIFSFDAEGRLFHVFLYGRACRIGMDGKGVELHGGGPESLPDARALSTEERDFVLSEVRTYLNGILDQSVRFESDPEMFLCERDAIAEIRIMMDRLQREQLTKQWRRFRELYGSVPILPPDCYASLLIQATTGCSYKRCTFCTLYQDRAFEIRDVDDFIRHVRSACEFQGQALPRWRSIFLGDANALVVPQKTLLERIGSLRKTLAEYHAEYLAETMYAFTDAGPPLRSADEYRQLAAAGLRRVYIGVETGLWPLREVLKKPGDIVTLTEKIRRLKDAGIGVGLILMAGIGGRMWARKHVEETVRVVHSYPLDSADILYVSPLRAPGLSSIGNLTEREIIAQTYHLLGRLSSGWKEKPPKVAPYDITRFVY